MSAAEHAAIDEVVELAGVHGWHVVDTREQRCVLWFSRGREYIHLGVDVDGNVCAAYGGVRGRSKLRWVTGRDVLAGQRPDRLARVAEALREPPFDTIETRESYQ